MTDHKEALRNAKSRMGALAKAAPDLFDGFTRVARAATKAGRFSAAQRELIATAISVVEGCEDCLLYHVDGARRHGADEAALIEALEVAIEMGGGPAMMYAGKALEAFRQG